MKKFIVFILSTIIYLTGYAQVINQPLLISGKVLNSSGNLINQNDLHFQVFLKDHPGHILTELSYSCGYDPPFWYAELGNFSVGWETGDILTVILEDLPRREQIKYEWQIDSTGQVPDLRTQSISVEQEINNFQLSDRGVYHGIPVDFVFNSVFDQLRVMEFKIISVEGDIIYKSDTPNKIESNKYQFIWNGKSSTGGFLRSGVYFYFLTNNKKLIHSGLVSLKND